MEYASTTVARPLEGRVARMVTIRMAASMVFTAVMLAGGVAATWHIGLTANHYEHELFHAKLALDDLRKEARKPQQAAQAKQPVAALPAKGTIAR